MKFTLKSSWLAQRPYLIAALITVVLVLWMASGPSVAEQKSEIKAQIPSHDEKQITAQVKVETRFGQHIHKTIELYGRTEPDRITTLKALQASISKKNNADKVSAFGYHNNRTGCVMSN